MKRKNTYQTSLDNDERLQPALSVHSWVRFFRPVWTLFSFFFSLRFWCCFFVRFLFVFGGHVGVILEPKSSQNAACVVCACVWENVRFGVFFGSFFASFFASIFDRFLIDFGVVLGGFWEAFGSPNRSFLASIF